MPVQKRALSSTSSLYIKPQRLDNSIDQGEATETVDAVEHVAVRGAHGSVRMAIGAVASGKSPK